MVTGPIFKKLLRIFLTVVLASILFFFLQLILTRVGLTNPLWPFIVTIGFLLYQHDQIAEKLRYFIDKNFYRRLYNLNQLLTSFNRELNTILDYQILLEKFIRFLETAFAHYPWAYYLRWGNDYELMAAQNDIEGLPGLLSTAQTDFMFGFSKEEMDFIPLKQWNSEYYSLEPFIDKELLNRHFYYILPLISYKGSTGFLLFGKELRYYIMFLSVREFLHRIFSKLADVMENVQLYSEVRRKSLQNHLLLEIGKKISATLDLNEVLETIIDSVQRLVNYDAAGIFLFNQQENRLVRSITRGYDENLLDRLLQKIDSGSYGIALRSQKSIVVNDVSQYKHYYKVRESTRSQVTIPLTNGDAVIGILALESDRLNHFTPMDLELLETFAGQIVIAIENAQLYEEATKKRQLESDLIYASEIQKALLPERAPSMPGVKVSAVNMPSRIVGGDIYDLFRVGEGKMGISIGDVSGKGVPASILMAVLYAGFKSLLKDIYPVVEVVARLNNQLTETTAEGYYATFFYGILDPLEKVFTYTNAGHNPPMVVHADKSVDRLKIGGIVLGFLKDQPYRQETVHLQSGDYLVLFTDGVTEVKNSEGEEFGDARLEGIIKTHYGLPPNEMKNKIYQEVQKFSYGPELPDDFTLIVVYIE